MRQMHLPEPQGDIALLRNLASNVEGGRKFGEIGGHLLRRLDVVRRILHTEPLFVMDVGAGLDADVNVLVLMVGLPHVMGIVGNHQRDAGVFVQPNQTIVDPGQLGDVFVALQFQKIILAEQLAVPANHLPGSVVIPIGKQSGHFGRSAPGHADHSLAILVQQFFIDSGTVVETFQVRESDQLEQVSVSRIVPGDQHQVIGGSFVGCAVVATSVRDVQFTTHDRFDPGFHTLGIEIHHTVQ